MKIALGSDHRGDAMVQSLATALRKSGHDVTIVYQCNGQACDYPDGAWRVARAVADGEFERGILMCGSGIGVSIAANKVPGVRAALVSDEVHARLSRAHNDANVLCMGAEVVSPKDVLSIALAWLSSPFEGGRHARRVAKIAAIERGEDPATANLDAAVR